VPVFEQHSIVLTRAMDTSGGLFYPVPGMAVDQGEPARIAKKCSWDARAGKDLG
jgi:hypothetical protein